MVDLPFAVVSIIFTDGVLLCLVTLYSKVTKKKQVYVAKQFVTITNYFCCPVTSNKLLLKK